MTKYKTNETQPQYLDWVAPEFITTTHGGRPALYTSKSDESEESEHTVASDTNRAFFNDYGALDRSFVPYYGELTEDIVSEPLESEVLIDAQLKFRAQLEVIKDKAVSLIERGHEMAAQAANALYFTLDAASTKYFDNIITKDSFKEVCDEAMKTAHLELDIHRGWKQVLGNLALAIAGLGVGYVIAGLINQAVTGRFLFFKTDSEHKLNDLQHSIDVVMAPQHKLG